MSDLRRSGPPLLNSVLEIRAGLEACALPYIYPFLLRAPRGEGRPVLLIPGFTNSDNATFFARDYLRRLGYDVYSWGLGANYGLRAETFEKLQQRLRNIHESTGQKVSLAGWSLGGFYVRALANSQAQMVRSIVTVGTTFCMPTPRAVNRVITRLYSYLNPYQQTDAFFLSSDLWETTPSVPSTSIYSKGDGINDWQYCLEKPAPRTENIRVFGSHSGLAVNAMVFYLLSNRLAQQPESWQPYVGPAFLQRARDTLAMPG